MNTKEYLKRLIEEERKLGMSLSELAKKYRLSKSTVSLWCRDVSISEDAQNLIKEKWLKSTAAARKKGTQANRDKRIASIASEYSQARSQVGKMTTRDMFVIGAALYWAEGSKKETGSGFSFVNSDSLMIKLMHDWLLTVMGIKKEQLIINVAINASHKDRESEILKFWSNLLDFPVKDFGSTTFIKARHSRVYDNHSSYFGMLRIKVRSSSWLRRRILGMIKIFTEYTPA